MRAESAARENRIVAGEATAPSPFVLLAWYDRHRRKLPWRAAPGERPNAYGVWLSEIMLQQTTVKAVAPYYARFLARWPNMKSLARAPLNDVLKLWAGLGYYARARNLHTCAKTVVERHDGRFPANEEDLRALPGIGPYTAAAIAAIAFDRPAVAIDGNVERVVTRLFAIKDQLPAAKPQIKRFAETLLPPNRAGDFAQALMDLGATICTPRNPACTLCPWSDACTACASGDTESFPRKAAKAEGSLRRGVAFVVTRVDGAMLLRTRPPKGLLGGMTEVPTSAWTKDFDEKTALESAAKPSLRPKSKDRIVWRRVPGLVHHTFTHFPLELVTYSTRVSERTPAPAGTRWVARDDIAGEALPSVMRKVLAHAAAKQE
jgi:A/G-specific adenine glycosylase